ncbi:hypothetical protein AL035_08480 [Salipiger aestuarii]|uniref:Uncharacterized protein n=1 Tax=Salipiger aestuarii TaxID=568098 RepID=A0A327YE59_9RHOB|nr:hypothetical protein [Salipiger aestuarii]KAB2542237.1 hypothetical protein AL035_08480 [Salipiger aestuarii]RAK16789.1 hypothetical protein ATI53_10186 [Salipiger aestuarii]
MRTSIITRPLALATTAFFLATAAIASDPVLATQGQNGGASAQPAPGYAGKTWVSPQGCSYSRAQAPGYAPTWHLILNGDRAGMTRAKRRCPGMLGGLSQL